MTIWALPWVYQYTDFQGFGSDGEWLATDNVIMVSVSGGGACRRDMSSYMECVVSWQKDGGVRDSSFQKEAMPNPDRSSQQEHLVVCGAGVK